MNGVEKELKDLVGYNYVSDKEKPPCGFDDTVPVGGHVGTGDQHDFSQKNPPRNPGWEDV